MLRLFRKALLASVLILCGKLLAVTQWNIVHKDALEEAEELSLHLSEATGGKCQIFEEDKYGEKTPALYIGQTEFAKKNGVDFSSFKAEEWIYKSVDENVIIAGHRHAGSQIAVYNFLENELGIRWYNFESTYIPKKPGLSFAKLDESGRPKFILRGIYMPPWEQKVKNVKEIFLFEKRNRLNGYSSPHSPTTKRRTGHNFYIYVDPEIHFATHPEYFSMNQDGQRFYDPKTGCGSQLCMTNPMVAEIAYNSLKKYIEEDRARLPAEKWPIVYDISQNDNADFMCLCAECKKLTEQEGSESALILNFINKIAEKISADYPEIIIRTMAYVSTETAPKNMRPHKNVLMQVCDLYTTSDCYRPLTHPFNAKRKEIFAGWQAKGANIAVWDYWNMGIQGVYFDPPRVESILGAIPEDMRFLYKMGVRDFFTEAETNIFENPQNFYDLHFWLGCKLLEDPFLDAGPLVSDFMQNHYGPAASPLTKLLHFILDKVAQEPVPLYYIHNPARTYQTADFLMKCYDLLKEAWGLTEPNSAYRLRVEREMITPLAVMLLNGQTGVDQELLAQEYESCRLGQINAYAAENHIPVLKENLAKTLQKYTLKLDMPEKFSHIPPSQIKQFAYPVFTRVSEEPFSSTGKAMISAQETPTNKHILSPQAGMLYPTSFGIYDNDTKKGIALHITDIPDDEKYHWYELGEYEFSQNTFLWAWFWHLNANLRSVWTNADGLEGYNKWKVWISVRITGPAYVEKSTKENAVMLDRIVLLK